MAITLAAKQLVTANTIIDKPLVTVEDGRIVSVSSRAQDESTSATHEFPDSILTAGLLDVHMHGALGHDVMEATRDALGCISRFLATRGITEYLATTVTATMDHTLQALDGIAADIEKGPADDEAKIGGIHIEGPFLSHAKRGMHPEHLLVEPSPELLNKFWEASRGLIKLMTIAPEVPGAIETIRRATQLGIRSSIGHSNATKEQTVMGLEAGATTATHTYNAMRPLDHREPGILGVVLDRDEVYSDLVCDGVHVLPELVRLWFKAKGPEKAILITDSVEATGMPEGTYKLGQTTVYVRDGRCSTANGTLAGSVITLDQAVSNMRSFTGVDLATAVRLASRNPARMLGIADDVTRGAVANFNVHDASGRHSKTILRGKLIE